MRPLVRVQTQYGHAVDADDPARPLRFLDVLRLTSDVEHGPHGQGTQSTWHAYARSSVLSAWTRVQVSQGQQRRESLWMAQQPPVNAAHGIDFTRRS